MVLNPNFSCPWQFMSHSLPLLFVTWAGRLGHLMVRTEEKKSEFLSLLQILGKLVSCFLPERAHIFSSLPFITSIPIESFLDALSIPGQALGLSFPNLIPGCSDNFSVFLPGYLSFPSSSVGFLFVSWVCPGDPFSPT